METPPALRQKMLRFQRVEITEHHIYLLLAKSAHPIENRQVLETIAGDELRHYHDWKGFTGQDVAPFRIIVWFYTLIGRILGFTFGIKLMERGEERALANYGELRPVIPEIEKWIQDEDEHEQALIKMLDEERLHYAGSIVLGLNDALVELTGALAGLTLAFQNTKLIALSGIVTGVAAAMSMAVSEYLSTRSEQTDRQPLPAAIYTGVAYVVTVALLILPYLLIKNYYVDLVLALSIAVLIIAAFNYYISVAKDEPFRQRFLEMAGLSLGVAAISFVIGFVLKKVMGVQV